MRKIIVYCGEDIESKCEAQLHPFSEAKKAISAIGAILRAEEDTVLTEYSNSPDYISTIKHVGEAKGISVEFFLNGVSQGIEIDPIFEDFNRAFKFIDELKK